MPTDLTSVTNSRKWHIDHINNAPTAEAALRRMDEFLRAELRDCQLRRPQDADGFRWQVIHLLAGFALEIHRTRPAGEFWSAPKLPGGGWVPKPGASNVRHP